MANHNEANAKELQFIPVIRTCHSCESNPHTPGCPYIEYLGAQYERAHYPTKRCNECGNVSEDVRHVDDGAALNADVCETCVPRNSAIDGITSCPMCGDFVHPSESDDHGVCSACAVGVIDDVLAQVRTLDAAAMCSLSHGIVAQVRLGALGATDARFTGLQLLILNLSRCDETNEREACLYNMRRVRDAFESTLDALKKIERNASE